MKFCHDCGGLLERRAVAAAEPLRLVCTRCARIQYENPKVLVMSLITFESRILLVRRITEPRAGYWAPPAGFVELGESMDVAAAREVMEEAGVAVDPHALDLHVVSNLPQIGEIYVCFRGAASTKEVFAGKECDHCAFFDRGEIPWDQLAYPELVGYIDGLFIESSRDAFSVHYTCTGDTGMRVTSYAISARRSRTESIGFRPFPKPSYLDTTFETD